MARDVETAEWDTMSICLVSLSPMTALASELVYGPIISCTNSGYSDCACNLASVVSDLVSL